MLNIAILRSWNVRTPVLYRYMEQRYIDEFFETGRLRLSCFHAFKRYPDEQLGDKWEGWNVLFGTDGSQTLVGVTNHGQNSYVFCTSTLHQPALYSAFGANGCFRIRDSPNFAAAIATSIAGFQTGVEGLCSYQDRRSVERTIGPLNFEALKTDPNSLGTVVARLNEIAGADVYFVKHMKYSHQCEYRLVWHVSAPANEPLIITCKEAVQFCEKLERAKLDAPAA